MLWSKTKLTNHRDKYQYIYMFLSLEEQWCYFTEPKLSSSRKMKHPKTGKSTRLFKVNTNNCDHSRKTNKALSWSSLWSTKLPYTHTLILHIQQNWCQSTYLMHPKSSSNRAILQDKKFAEITPYLHSNLWSPLSPQLWQDQAMKLHPRPRKTPEWGKFKSP